MNNKDLRERFEKMFDHYNPKHDDGTNLPYWNNGDWGNMIDFLEQEVSLAYQRGREEIKLKFAERLQKRKKVLEGSSLYEPEKISEVNVCMRAINSIK